MTDFFRIGIIKNTHGLLGELKVRPTTDAPERFMTLSDAFVETKKGMVPVRVKNARPANGLMLVTFENFGSIDDVQPFKGCGLFVSREDAIPLEEGEYYIADILGAAVITDDGRELGTLKEYLETGANGVFIISTPQGGELLVPDIPQCVVDVNTEEKILTVHLLEGLE